MKIRISELYTQPGISFRISNKVTRFMEGVLNKRFIKPYALDEKQRGVTLSLMIGTEKERMEAEAKGPSHDRKNKIETWGLWLPYEEVMQSPNQLKVFIDKFFEAAGQVLVKYGIKCEDIEQANAEVNREVIGNVEYVYRGQEIPPPDLSRFRS